MKRSRVNFASSPCRAAVYVYTLSCCWRFYESVYRGNAGRAFEERTRAKGAERGGGGGFCRTVVMREAAAILSEIGWNLIKPLTRVFFLRDSFAI